MNTIPVIENRIIRITQEKEKEKEPQQNLTLAERDEYMIQLEKEIETKRNFLINKRKELEKMSKKNKFLENVRQDYDKYNQYIVKEKERQLRAMHILKQYINDIIVTGKLTDEDLEQTKKEEINILREIHSIKQNLDELVKI